MGAEFEARAANHKTARGQDFSEQPLVELRQVHKVYANAAGPFLALRGATASFKRGEMVAILGRSGAGKSTLINMITAVDRATSGQVLVDGVSIQDLSENEAALWRGRNMGIIHQSFELLPTLSLLENVMLPMDFCGLYHPVKSPQRAMQLLVQVGLEEHVNKPPTRISGGQQQRVAIARALANDPQIILADEPTGNLDSTTADDIIRLFEGLVAEGKTVILVTHDEVLARRATRVLHIVDGCLLQDEMMEAPIEMALELAPAD